MDAVALAFAVVFVAELGDKTQLVVLSLASRHPVLPVVAGMLAAHAITQGLSVIVGGLLGAALPSRAIAVAAGVAFLGFALWTLRGEEEDGGAPTPAGSVMLTVASALVVAELGDKTMLASATLAARSSPALTWIGGTAGIVAAGGVAVVAGRVLGARLPQRTMRLVAAGLFALVGIALLVDAALG